MEGGESSSPRAEDTFRSSSPSFPFFNHNASTLPNQLPPSVDDKPLARQKRKRTSPEDQAVLEAYFARDPKPDKAARLELVKKVALGEKEVQIWFQNRRQSSRRKSRPLLPHEIAQYQLSKSTPAPGVHPQQETGPSADQDAYQNREEHLAHPQSTLPAVPSTVQHASAAAGSESNANPTTAYETSQDQRPLLENSQVPPSSQRTSSFPSSERTEYLTSFDTPAARNDGPGYLANRRSAPDLHDGRRQAGHLPHGHPARTRSPRRVRKASSFVRLSMNSEGGAEVVAKDTESPSPPRASVAAHPVHGTAGTVASSTPEFSASQPAQVDSANTLKRASSGRSRDSRAWEFWCDKDCRSELEDKAEKDSSGSAADAIQLLRSASGRNILGAVPAKRNSALPGHSATTKRLRREGRAPLQRSSTTNGRMQGKPSEKHTKTRPKLKDSKSATSIQIPGNDSDKENWSPNSDLQSEDRSFEDEENTSRRPPSGSFTFEKRHSRAQRESIDPENDPEIAAFMRAGRESDKVSDHEELDCVQGLLSLSQGNWR